MRLMSFSMPIQWHHSHEDPIWPDGTFQIWSDPEIILAVLGIWILLLTKVI